MQSDQWHWKHTNPAGGEAQGAGKWLEIHWAMRRQQAAAEFPANDGCVMQGPADRNIAVIGHGG